MQRKKRSQCSLVVSVSRKMDDFRWAEAEKSAAAVASRSGAEKCYRLAATRGTSEFYGSTARRGVEPFKIRIHRCLEHVSAIPEAELMSAGVLARDFSAWSCGTSCGAASASGIAQGCIRQLWTRILMVFPQRLVAQHLLDVVFVHGLTACPRFTMSPREAGHLKGRCFGCRHRPRTFQTALDEHFDDLSTAPGCVAPPQRRPCSRSHCLPVLTRTSKATRCRTRSWRLGGATGRRRWSAGRPRSWRQS